MAEIQISTVFNIDLNFETAPVGRRIVAYFIDLLLLFCYASAVKYLLYNQLDLNQRDYMGLDILLVSVPMLLYNFVCEVLMNGQSVGKKIMQMRVMSLEGGEPTLSQYLLRWITRFFEWPFFFGYIVNFEFALIIYAIFTCIFGLGVLIAIASNKKNQRIGDLAAGTVVIDTRQKHSVADTIFVQVDNTDYVVKFPQVMRLSDNDINTIKSVLTYAQKTNKFDRCYQVEYKLKEILEINSNLYTIDFLEQLIRDYNYLAQKEG